MREKHELTTAINRKPFHMKKSLLIIAVILLASHVSFGQFKLGIRVGYNANKLTTNMDTIKSSFRSGFHVGVYSHFGKRFYLAPELLYTFSGGIFTGEGTVSNGWKQKITVGSMDIPVLVGFKIIHSKLITWRIEAGPEASFVLNKKVEDMNDLTGPLTGSNLNTANWYIMAGTGIDVLFLSLDVRYQYILNDLVKNYDTKNSLIAVSLGIKIFGSK
jgi:hypothetical protein